MCTTLIVTKGASADGSMMVAHSDDDELADQRLVLVPAADHAPGTLRKVFAEHYRCPRIVTDDRGPGYKPRSTQQETVPIGFISQVEHTFAYFDGNYGIMNEHNLMMGECTNGAKYQPTFVTAEEAEREAKRMRIMYSSELSRIALERTATAAKAIELMGQLIEEHGYYGTGETLLVADEDEAWVFEMCALPDDECHSAWVAQRVPDGTVFVAANEFRIREVKDGDDFMFSRFLFRGLEKVGWWDPSKGRLDWLRAVSEGEYNHPYYSLRRVWRVFDRVNPDLGLSPWVQDGFTEDYPFSIEPKREQRLCLEDVFSLYRDHYEGTQFDLTRGVAAGPYGDPHRFVGPYDGAQNDVTKEKVFYGAWERAISVFYQGYTFVNQIRPAAPEGTKGVVWFGPDVAYTTCFAPFPTTATKLPEAYQGGDPQIFDPAIAWWAFDFVASWSRLNFQRMCHVDVLPKQAKIEVELRKRLHELDEKIRQGSTPEIDIVNEFCQKNADEVVRRWWCLATSLIAKYSDGYVNLPDQEEPVAIGYPATWLVETGYGDGPTTYEMRPNRLRGDA